MMWTIQIFGTTQSKRKDNRRKESGECDADRKWQRKGMGHERKEGAQTAGGQHVLRKGHRHNVMDAVEPKLLAPSRWVNKGCGRTSGRPRLQLTAFLASADSLSS